MITHNLVLFDVFKIPKCNRIFMQWITFAWMKNSNQIEHRCIINFVKGIIHKNRPRKSGLLIHPACLFYVGFCPKSSTPKSLDVLCE